MTHRTAFGWCLTLLASLALCVGCEQQGPAERAGESIDNAADDMQDALDPRGPAEEAGAAVDDTLNN
ncbi:hypothetical protein AB1L88_10025 [Tautonia sp. JC769]|uniref:hypothetical protein n=1 Tax=Tautonia sp. JC769 TaxID=3232135 RepID=UPI00345A28DD